jgi:CheY-like chemotaxis protein
MRGTLRRVDREEEDVDNQTLARSGRMPILAVGDFDEAALTSLEAMGFTVHVAATGVEALAAVSAGLCPHLVLLDMQVPERMDRVVLAALKTKQLAEIPVVILSEFDLPKEDTLSKVFVLPAFDGSAIRRIAWDVRLDLRRTESLLAEARLKLDGPGGVWGFSQMMKEVRSKPTVIMVVEDDADHRAAIADVLQDAGYDVATAAHGRAALSELSLRPPPDLVLLDLMMPELDGWGFMEEVSRRPALSSIPVVVVSTGSKAMFEAAPQAAGYLRKPLDAGKLLRTVRACLRDEPPPRSPSDPGPPW